jgi:chloramphenicol 3-O-phosphotransferase
VSDTSAPILIVSGPSGAGKSTVARLVAAEFDLSVHMQSDHFLFSVVSGWVDPWLPEAAAQNEVVGGATITAALQFAQARYAVVLDGSFFPNAIDDLAPWATRHDVALHYAVLRPDLSTSLTRVQERRPGDPENFGAWAQLHARFADLGRYEANVIDAEGTPQEVAADLMDAFVLGRLQVS